MKFKLTSDFAPTGDQPVAIDLLTKGLHSAVAEQVLLGVTGSGKSLTSDEPILIIEQKEGSFKPQIYAIGDFIDTLLKTTEGKKVGDTTFLNTNSTQNIFFTLSIDPNTGSQEIQPILQFSRHRSPKKIYELNTKCGRKIKVTGDHNFWILRNGEFILVKTAEIKPSDYLPSPLKLDLQSKEIKAVLLHKWIKRNAYFNISDIAKNNISPANLRQTLGYNKYYRVIHKNERIDISNLQRLSYSDSTVKFLTIGRRTGHKVPLYFRLTKELLYLLGLYIAEGHGEDNYLLWSVHEPALQLSFKKWLETQNISYKERSRNLGDFQINNSILAEVFAAWCGTNAYNKKLPPWFLQLSEKQLSNILSAYFSGDGTVTSNEITAVTTSRNLASDLQYALLRFGIVARVRTKFKKATNSLMDKKEYFEIIISGSNVRKFSADIDFVLKRKQDKLAHILKKKNNTNVDVVPLKGEDLKVLREHLKFSQKKLAELAKCERSYISMIEHNKRKPSRTLLIILLNIIEPLIHEPVLFKKIQVLKSFTRIFWTQVKNIKTIQSSSPYVYDLAVNKNETFLAGLGGLYVHNTFTMANVIQQTQRPTLIISHNKTLAAQLYQEFKSFFPENAVSYFVSYYDYYQPEAYIPQTDTYIEKETEINEEIDKLRLASTTNLLTRTDTIIVASVSCIYNIGNPKEYGNFILDLRLNLRVSRESIIARLVELQYSRSDYGFHRGTFRVRGDSIDVYPAYKDTGIRIEHDGNEVTKIAEIDTLTGNKLADFETFVLYPAKHYMSDQTKNSDILKLIESDLEKEVAAFKKKGKLLEANRLHQKVHFDLEMIREVGFVNGIENYSSYFDGRKPGEAPYTLFDYYRQRYGNEWLLIIDESHMTIPQIRGMYSGDRSRKENLINFGFRLRSALDNRPLKFDEYLRRIPQTVYVSATPSIWEIGRARTSSSKPSVVEQLIRPTGLVDPEIEIRPSEGQIIDLEKEIRARIAKKERTLVTTLTKRMAEDLATYLKERDINVQYLHADVLTLERSDILDDLRNGKYDVLVGINLLREGLDLPEVSLVAILDADREGFLRSEVSLIQTMGRAARHISGKVIMYADHITGSMQRAIDEVSRRRTIQQEYNLKNNITPLSIHKPIREKLVDQTETVDDLVMQTTQKGSQKDLLDFKEETLTPQDKKRLIKQLEKEMRESAENLNFEFAARLRDRIRELKSSA